MRNILETSEPLVSHRGNTPSHEPKRCWQKVMACRSAAPPQQRDTSQVRMNARASGPCGTACQKHSLAVSALSR